MRMTIRTSGFSALEQALVLLPQRTAKTVLERTLLKAGQPIADHAQGLAPVDTGELAESMTVSTRLGNNVGKSEFHAVLKAGGTRSQAVSAMRGARRAARGEGSFAVAFVGPTKARTKRSAIKRIVQEFGSVKQAPQPYLRPAWDAKSDEALAVCRSEMANEIIKAAKRLAKNKRKDAGVKYQASLAALLAHEADGSLS